MSQLGSDIEENPSLETLFRYRFVILASLLGLIILGFGIFYARNALNVASTKVEVLEASTESQKADSFLVVDISGAVEKPGVYKLPSSSRVEAVLIAAGGVSGNADRSWMDKFLNRAGKLSDGQKIYIPTAGEQGYQTASSTFSSKEEGLVNINTATLKELDTLPGIGLTYAQNIIEHRPYSNVEELLSKGVLRKSVYEKIKDKITVY